MKWLLNIIALTKKKNNLQSQKIKRNDSDEAYAELLSDVERRKIEIKEKHTIP